MKKKSKTFFDERGVKYSYLDNENSSDVKLVLCPRYIEGEFQTKDSSEALHVRVFGNIGKQTK